MSLTQPVNESLRFRCAEARDAEPIAALHTASWRRHYRGAYADSFLDGDIATDRRSVWSSRLAAPRGTETILAEHAGQLVGFIHVVFDDDPSWGSLIDNLHIAAAWRRNGIGTQLLSSAAAAIGERAASPGVNLWVLEQNVSAQQFYRACGAACVQTMACGVPVRSRCSRTPKGRPVRDQPQSEAGRGAESARSGPGQRHGHKIQAARRYS